MRQPPICPLVVQHCEFIKHCRIIIQLFEQRIEREHRDCFELDFIKFLDDNLVPAVE
jgi:hypothetical protein